MSPSRDIWAVVPIKETEGAKQRLSGLLSERQRRTLALAMAEDVLDALARTAGLAGILVVTRDAAATRLARRFGARVSTSGAREGHTGAVRAAIQLLLREARAGILQIPGDIPRATPAELGTVLAEHRPAPAFTIAAAHDARGSNAVLLSPPGCVPLQFGDDSFLPHLDAARRQNIEPTILHLPGIGMDIDHPSDLARFLAMTPRVQTRTLAYLESSGIARAVIEAGLAA